MRILRIRFQNLNSLAGEWEIDMTHPAFTSDGIFAITGPTGAGKTTILDAICLALYGRTPRLERVTKSSNEIMSRRNGECFAEVTFETQTGRYRCYWSQRRARKRPEGELQAPKHEIARDDTGEIIESSIRGVAESIETVTGMDFHRFTRSMLLAQGGFAAFLQAGPDDRAPILEQITGTEIYSRISILVHERARLEREKLERLRAEIAGIHVFSQDEEAELLAAVEKKRREEATLLDKSAATEAAISRRTTLEELKNEIAALEEERKALQLEMDAFEPERQQLHRGRIATTLEGIHAIVQENRKSREEDLAALKQAEETLPHLESSLETQENSLRRAETISSDLKQERDAAIPVWQKVRSLEQTIARTRDAVNEEEQHCREEAIRCDADRRRVQAGQENLDASRDTLHRVERYLQEHAQDEWLMGNLAGLEEQLTHADARRHAINEKAKEKDRAAEVLRTVTKTLAESKENRSRREKELEDAEKLRREAHQELEQILGERRLREYRAEKEGLWREIALQRRITELEDHRAALEDGSPCPLCGATEHPYARGNVPVTSGQEERIQELDALITAAEAQETRIAERDRAVTTAGSNLSEAIHREKTAQVEERAAEKTLEETGETLRRLQSEALEQERSTLETLHPLGFTEIPPGEIPEILETLRERRKQWSAKTEEKRELEKRIGELRGEVQRLDAVIETRDTALNERYLRLKALKDELATTENERVALFGDTNPDSEENRLQDEIAQAELAEKHARTLCNDLRQKRDTAAASAKSLQERIHDREPLLELREKEFSDALAPAGFSDEADFLAARLDGEHLRTLEKKSRDLDHRRGDLESRRKDREARLATATAAVIDDAPLEELRSRREEERQVLEETRELIAEHRHRLKENTTARERIQERRAAIIAQESEHHRWGSLHDLIGSSDGKKYRNFAQGLTFEMVIGQANRKLQALTDRYLLVPDDTRPLELNVIDTYQAGEIRSTKNLSGGESFIVSLSLALGLSQMAGRNVRVDSLFLDEGFGTLDEEALDTALETLARLQQDGKIIGIISHVPVLKERISTRIRVTPQTGGLSKLSGPGCTAGSILTPG